MTNADMYHSSVDLSGRIPMPVALRRDIGVEPGSKVYWVKDDLGIHLRKFEDVIKDVQRYFMSLSPPDDVWSETLIKARKEEAARE